MSWNLRNFKTKNKELAERMEAAIDEALKV
jgi:hypothetical protein